MKHIVDTGRLPDGLDLLSFCDGLVFFAPVALLVRTTAGVSAGQFFLLQALIAAAALLGELPCGRLTDRIGYRSTIPGFPVTFPFAVFKKFVTEIPGISSGN